MSLYAEYIKEREGKSVLETDNGFATYAFCGSNKEECYIIDIYVKPEKRKDGEATKLANTIAEIAKQFGCKYLSGSVDPQANGATESLKVLLSYGFSLVGIGNNLIWFRKDI